MPFFVEIKGRPEETEEAKIERRWRKHGSREFEERREGELWLGCKIN